VSDIFFAKVLNHLQQFDGKHGYCKLFRN